jgi:hypothetical protein
VWRHFRALVYPLPANDVETTEQLIANGGQAIPNTRCIFEHVQQSVYDVFAPVLNLTEAFSVPPVTASEQRKAFIILSQLYLEN